MPNIQLYDDMAKAVKAYIQHPDNQQFIKVAVLDVIVEASRHISKEDFVLVVTSILRDINKEK